MIFQLLMKYRGVRKMLYECESPHCTTRINGSSLGRKADGTSRRNTKCAKCCRLLGEKSRVERICQVGGCKTLLSKCDGRRMKRCARCIRLKQSVEVEG